MSLEERKFRFIDRRHGRDSLSSYERVQLEDDYDIALDGFYALVPVTKTEFEQLKIQMKKDD